MYFKYLAFVKELENRERDRQSGFPPVCRHFSALILERRVSGAGYKLTDTESRSRRDRRIGDALVSLPVHIPHLLRCVANLAPVITHKVEAEPIVGGLLTVAERTHKTLAVPLIAT